VDGYHPPLCTAGVHWLLGAGDRVGVSLEVRTSQKIYSTHFGE
jgi:hypothetical protein